MGLCMLFQIDPSKLLMIVPSDVAGLINGSIEEISRDGTVRFRPFVKDGGETTTPTKRRRTSSVSLTGTICIKIGLPGKSILGDYFQENIQSGASR